MQSSCTSWKKGKESLGKPKLMINSNRREVRMKLPPQGISLLSKISLLPSTKTSWGWCGAFDFMGCELCFEIGGQNKWLSFHCPSGFWMQLELHWFLSR